MRSNIIKWMVGLFLIGITVMAGCGGGGGGSGGYIPASTTSATPNISGGWAGTWSGDDPVSGWVTGNWQADVLQVGSSVSGSGILSGDVDCSDSTLSGAVGANNVPSGTLTRQPCQQNNWTITALDLTTRSVSGTWTQPGSGASGTFTGTQVAKPGGPQISFFTPQGGIPGAIMTVVGSGFDPLITNDLSNVQQQRSSPDNLCHCKQDCRPGTARSSIGTALPEDHQRYSHQPPFLRRLRQLPHPCQHRLNHSRLIAGRCRRHPRWPTGVRCQRERRHGQHD